MKKIYKITWFLLAILFFATLLTGSLNPLSLLTFSLVALALIYALALWTAFSNTKDIEPDYLRKI